MLFRSQKEKLLNQMDLLVEKLLEEIIPNEVYQRKQKELEQKLSDIQGKIKELEQKKVKGSTLGERLIQIEQALKMGNTVEKAGIAEILDEVEKILIYPEHMEIVFSLSKITGMEKYENCLKVEYGDLFDYRKKKRTEREMIVDMMREDPQITARKIAEALGISLSGANYRIRVLKSEGKVRFNGSGGKGEWEILR